MPIYHIGGNGGVKFEIVGEGEVVFPAEIATAEIEPDEEYIERKDLNGIEQEWYQGERHTIKCRIYNVDETGYGLIRLLAQVIDRSKRDRVPIRVYPNYNADASGSEYYDCRFMGKWQFERIFELLELGQKMPELVFRSIDLRSTHSIHIDKLTPTVRVTTGGNRRIVAGGGVRIVKS